MYINVWFFNNRTKREKSTLLHRFENMRKFYFWIYLEEDYVTSSSSCSWKGFSKNKTNNSARPEPLFTITLNIQTHIIHIGIPRMPLQMISVYKRITLPTFLINFFLYSVVLRMYDWFALMHFKFTIIIYN